MRETGDDLSSFGALLKTLRKRRRMTQQQLAEALGMHRSAILRWEQGEFLPESKTLVLELARHLRLDNAETRQLLEASLTALAPHWQVPLQRNLLFTGREEILEALHAQLGTDQSVALTQSSALHGLGGIGKTQVALEYAYRYALEYSAVFWIGAETEEQIVHSLLRIAEVLQLPVRDNKDQQHVIAAVQRWLATHGQWLLICDNVEDLALLSRFLPPTRSGAVLITTRRRILGTFARGLDLLPMEQEEGVLFLLRRAKILPPEATGEQVQQLIARVPDHYAAAEELVKAMGGLPLALDQAGAYLEATQCGLSTYLDLFRTHRATLLQQRGEGALDHPESVATTFSLAIVATARQHPAVWDLLRVCAFLQPDVIPEEVFRLSGEHLGATLAAVCRDELEWNRVIALLCAYSLLSRQSEDRTLSLHRLVQAVLLDTMTDAERQMWTRRIIETLDEMFSDEEYETWKQGERLLPHALLCLHRAETTENSLVFAALAFKTAQYLCALGRYTEADPLYQRALQVREQLLGPEHPQVALALHNLGRLYREQGRYEQAEALLQRALHIREQILGPDHLDVAESLLILGILSRDQGRHEQAQTLLQRALRIREQTLEPDHLDVAESLLTLGILCGDQGAYAQAEALHQQALRIREQVLGPEHPQVALPLLNLGNLYVEQGKYQEARSVLERGLSIWKRTLGFDHLNTTIALLNLGDLYVKEGKYELAEPLYQRALDIREQILGPDHPRVTHLLNSLGDLYVKEGKYELAETFLERAWHRTEQVLGPHHPYVAYPLTSLGTLYMMQGKYEQAEALLQRALSIREQVPGQNHLLVAELLQRLADLYRAQGKHEQAEAFSQRALSIQEDAPS